MSKIERTIPDDWHPDHSWSRIDQEQEEDIRSEQREASGLLAFVVLCLAIGVAGGWLGILSGRI